MTEETPAQRVQRIVAEFERAHPGSVVRQGDPLGSEGNAVVELLREELQARVALQQLGAIQPSDEQIADTAYWLAEALLRLYRVERRFPGS
jgi:hypothetical protein